jgi:hypothetical protein
MTIRRLRRQFFFLGSSSVKAFGLLNFHEIKYAVRVPAGLVSECRYGINGVLRVSPEAFPLFAMLVQT